MKLGFNYFSQFLHFMSKMRKKSEENDKKVILQKLTIDETYKKTRNLLKTLKLS